MPPENKRKFPEIIPVKPRTPNPEWKKPSVIPGWSPEEAPTYVPLPQPNQDPKPERKKEDEPVPA